MKYLLLIKSQIMHFFCLCSLLLISNNLWAQSFHSKLPIVLINTYSSEIVNKHKIEGRMSIISNNNNSTNYITNTPNVYDGYCGIELRGNSTLLIDKKSYSVELRNKENKDTAVTLLGMGKEEDWILYASAFDPSFANNELVFELWRKMGYWASKTRLCEVFINNDYRGIYFLTEKIKRDKNRLDIAKLKEKDIAGKELTGGYIIRLDWIDKNALGWFSKYASLGEDRNIFFQYYYPKGNRIQPEQARYIQNYVDSFEMALFSLNYELPNGQHYSNFMDVQSLVDFFIINELSKSVDAYKLSTYLYKDKNTPLKMGLVWDFDLAFGNADICEGNKPEGWIYKQFECDELLYMPRWWEQLEKDDYFLDKLRCRWIELRADFLKFNSLEAHLDQILETLKKPIEREGSRWGISTQEYKNAVEQRKNWLIDRIFWLDIHIPGYCLNDSLGKISNLKDLVSCFPNPVKDQLHLEFKAQRTFQVQIFDVLGKRIFGGFFRKKQLKLIDVSYFKSGIYFVEVVAGKDQKTFKIIK